MNSSTLQDLLAEVRFPDMVLVRQDVDASRIDDVRVAMGAEFVRLGPGLKPGQSVAIAVGSRGIDRLDQVVRSLCDLVQGMDARPFIVPAMGSHGGATASGQAEVLSSLGVTEQAMGVPVRSSMEVVQIGQSDQGFPVLMDAMALGADHLMIVNRIKAHTKFKAPVESGLMKMLAVGLGNDQGARLVHGLAPVFGMYEVITSMATTLLAKGNLLCAAGLVENGRGQLHTVRMLWPWEIMDQEPQLLTLAKKLAPKLPCAELDVLIVDEIGKDISGTGMDTNVTGRNRDILGNFSTSPKIKRIFVRDLSPGTAGNALGIGFADVTTDRALRAMDYARTAINALTGLSPEKAALPLHFPTDRMALAAAIHTLGAIPTETLRMARIRNTKSLEELYVSRAVWSERLTGMHHVHGPRPFCFQDDDLPPFPCLPDHAV